MKNIRRHIRSFSLLPESRIISHVDYLRKNIDIKHKTDKQNFDRVYESFTLAAKKLRIYRLFRNIIFFFLYISAITALVSSVSSWIAYLLEPFIQLASILGVTVLTILLLFFNRLINIIVVELTVEHSHLVALAVKHNNTFEVHPKYLLGLFPEYD